MLAAINGKDFNDRRDLALLRFMLDTGCRIGEAITLRVADLDTKAGVALVYGKGRKARVRQTVAAVEVNANVEGVMALTVAKHLSIDKSNASRRLRVAADAGFVRNLEDRRGKPARWVIGDPLPEDVEILPDPAALDGCAVARTSQEKERARVRAAEAIE
jgi:integrase